MIGIVEYASPDHLLLTNISVIVHNPDRTPLLVLLGRSKWRRQAPQTSSPVSFITVTKSESSPGKNISHPPTLISLLCLIFKRVATRRKCIQILSCYCFGNSHTHPRTCAHTRTPCLAPVHARASTQQTHQCGWWWPRILKPNILRHSCRDLCS